MLSVNKAAALLSNRASFLMAGTSVAAWAPMIPYIKERFMLDEHTLGLLLLCVGTGAFCFMPISSITASRIGCKVACRFCACMIGFCLIAATLLQNIFLLGVVLFLFGMFSVALDVLSNINAAKLELDLNTPIMSGLHGLYSVGGIVGALGVTFLLSQGMSLVNAAILLTVVLAAAALIFFQGLYGRDPDSSAPGRTDKQNKKSKLKTVLHPLVLTIGVLCFVLFMTEGAILDWSGVFLNEHKNVDISRAGYGYAAFAAAMTIFRLTGDRIVKTFGRRTVIVVGALVVAGGFLISVLSSSSLGALAGFFLIGCGAANIVPQLVSQTASIKEVPVHVSVAVVNAIGFTGTLAGPALIGFIAHQISLPYTFMVLSCGVIIVGMICFLILKKPA